MNLFLYERVHTNSQESERLVKNDVMKIIINTFDINKVVNPLCHIVNIVTNLWNTSRIPFKAKIPEIKKTTLQFDFIIFD